MKNRPQVSPSTTGDGGVVLLSIQESRFRTDLVIIPTLTESEGELGVLVRDIKSGRTFRFERRKFYLCKNWDGIKSEAEICNGFHQRFGTMISRQEFNAFLGELAAADLLEPRVQTAAKLTTGRPPPEFIWSFSLPARWLKQVADTAHEFCWLGPVTLWLSVPCTVLAIATLLHNTRALGYDLDALFQLPLTEVLTMHFGTMWALQLMALGLQALVLSFFGAQVRRLGFRLECGFLPVIDIATEELEELTRSQRLWVYGTPLILRLMVTVAAVMLWFTTRFSGGLLSQWALFMAISGSLQLATYGSPLWYHDGYYLLTTYMRKPQILPQAQLLCLMIIRRRNLPMALGRVRAIGLGLLGVISMVFSIILLVFLAILFSNSVGKLLYGLVGQAGPFLTLIVLTAVFLRFLVDTFVKFSETS